ncbi:MAG: hypothetical protein V4623_09460 [Pseudomonadota bacterium]
MQKSIFSWLKHKFRKPFSAFLCALCFGVCAPSSALAYFVDVVIDEEGTPFLLDDQGEVWAYRKPATFEGLFKLPNLKNIVKLAPFMAVDKDGQLFIWRFDEKTVFTVNFWTEIDAVYTEPEPLVGFDHVTQITSTGAEHFVFVQNNVDIYELRAQPIPERSSSTHLFNYQFLGYQPIKKIHSRSGVKSVALVGYGIAALYDDGTVLGWPDNKDKKLVHPLPEGTRFSFKAPAPAESIHLTSNQALLLTKQGRLAFIGGCPVMGNPFNNGSYDSWAFVQNKNGIEENLTQVAIDAGISDIYFLKRDGSVWRSNSTSLYQEGHPERCAREPSRNQKIKGLKVPAQKIAAGGFAILALGKDHSLWQAGSRGNEFWPEHFIKLLEGK